MAKVKKDTTVATAPAAVEHTKSVETAPAVPAPVKETKTTATKAKVSVSPGGDTDMFERVFVDGKPTVPMKEGQTSKVAPQAQLILNVIQAAPDHKISRKDLVEKLIPAGLITRQPPSRILGYYQKPLIDLGLITLTKGTKAEKVAVPAAVEVASVTEDSEEAPE